MALSQVAMKHASFLTLAALSCASLTACGSGDNADIAMATEAAGLPAVKQDPIANKRHAQAVANMLITEDGDNAQSNTVIAGTADLDGDGKEEILAYIMGPSYCGEGGCQLRIFKFEEIANNGTAFTPIAKMTVANLPIGMMENKTNGYADLAVTVRGGGGSSGVSQVPFDGKNYAANPAEAPAKLSKEPSAMILSGDDLHGNASLKIETQTQGAAQGAAAAPAE
jgi:hypothetical protein